MPLQDLIQTVLSRYPAARNQVLTDHELAELIRKSIPRAIATKIPTQRYKVYGSAGQGNWAAVPWVAVFDKLITETAQDGFYIVYLFREDSRGVYLSLKGVTTARQLYRKDAKRSLRARAADFLGRISKLPPPFLAGEITLNVSELDSLGAYYEAGNICACKYDSGEIPASEILLSHLNQILDVYRNLVDQELTISEPLEPEEEAHFEDPSKFRLHKRVERNHNLIKAVKRTKGYTCEACGFNFEKRFREIGRGFIEAHHLTPISKLEGTKIQLDPSKDFAVLCSNCHRMIHKSEWLSDVDSFKRAYGL